MNRRSQSLSQATAINVAVRVGIVILIATAIAYYHVTNVVTEKTLEYLSAYINDRSERDAQILKLGEDNHLLVKKLVLQRMAIDDDAVQAKRFDALFKQFDDGTTRSRIEDYNGETDPFGFIGRQANIDAHLKKRVMIFYDLSKQLGPAWHHRFQNIYFTTPANILVGYWPEVPTWAHDASADLYIPAEEYFSISTKENDPERESRWTGLFYDVVGKTWMVSLETPVDYMGEHIATIGHDIPVSELQARTIDEHLAGSYNMIFGNDGRVIAHPVLTKNIETTSSDSNIKDSGDDSLRRIYTLVTQRETGKGIIDNSKDNQYLAVSTLAGPDWYYVTVYPKSLVSDAAFSTARIILLLGFFSLVIEIFILLYVLGRNINSPLAALLKAVNAIAQGNYDIRVEPSMYLETQQIGISVNRMATAIKQRRIELQEKEQRMQAMFNNAQIGIAQISLDGNFITVNPQLCEIVGYNEEELLSKTFQEITYPEDLGKDMQHVLSLIEGKDDKYQMEKRYIHKDGSIVWIHLAVSIVRNPHGSPLYFISVIENIQRRKEAEQQLVKHQARLETLVDERTRDLHKAQDELIRKERLAALGQLTATVSHELRNPLSAIRPSLFVIGKKTAGINDEKLIEAIARVERSVTRCDHIIDELLDFTRITHLDTAPIELDAWLGTLISEQTLPRQVRLATEYGLANTIVMLDSSRFRRAFINVFENASQALLKPDGSNDFIESASLTVKTYMDTERISVCITDNGYGIPDDVMQNIFEPLFSTKGFGVGLGMPTVKQIMEQHKGGVDIVSNPGKGTTVSLWLPRSAEYTVPAA